MVADAFARESRAMVRLVALSHAIYFHTIICLYRIKVNIFTTQRITTGYFLIIL